MTPSDPNAPTADPRRVLVACSLLVLAVAVTFWPALHGEFVYDDELLVVSNPTVWSLDGLKAALTSAYWDFLEPEEAAHIGYWRPLSSIALYVGFQLGDGTPLALHALSIALHALAALVVLRFVLAWTRRLDAACVAGLLFGLHPVHVESVAWISSINAPLQGLLGFLTLDAWLRARQSDATRIPRLAPVWLLLALLAKESSFALLPMLLAVDWGLQREGRARFSVRAHLPIALCFALYYLLRVGVFGDCRAGFDRVTTHLGVTAERLVSLRIEILGGFLGLATWPQHLNAFRDVRPEVPWSDPAIVSGALWIGAWSVLTIVAWRRRAGLAFTGLSCIPFGVLPMVVRVLSIGRFMVSDRFLYLAILGIGCCAAALVVRSRRRSLAWTAALSLAVLGGWRSHERTLVWHDEVSLFETAVSESPSSPYVWWSFGRALLDRYRETGERRELDRAREAFEQVVSLHDRARDGDGTVFASTEDFHQANLGQGYVYLFEAIEDPPHEFVVPETIFRTTIELEPESEYAYIGLGTTLMHAGRYEESRTAFEEALERNPKAWKAWFGLGRLEIELSNWQAAVSALERIEGLAIEDPPTCILLASALANSGEHARALAILNEVVAAHPELAEGHAQLATVEAMLGRFAAAFDRYTRATRLDPENAQAWLDRGKVAFQLGRLSDARESFRKACRLDPGNFEANYNFASLLGRLGEYEDAIVIYENAASLAPDPELERAIAAEIARLRAL